MFCFVILHYEAINETIDCVESIKNNIIGDNIYSIVIVDNNSPNKSGKQLKNMYKKYSNIYVLLNDENLGFAKGNNIGFDFAKKKLQAQFIACINNDTEIVDSNFISKIINCYENNQFSVMGPDIITTDGTHQNPYRIKPISLLEVNNYISNYRYSLFKALFKAKIKQVSIINKFIKKVRKQALLPMETNLNSYHEHEKENVVLHGSALVFSPLYINSEDYAFYPETFMYEEEQILFYLCEQKGYKIVYSPITKILHKEDASTNLILNDDYKKLKFMYENELKSHLILKKIIEKN